MQGLVYRDDSMTPGAGCWLLGFWPEQRQEWGCRDLMWGRAGGLCITPVKVGSAGQVSRLKVRAKEPLGGQGPLRTL